MNELRMLIAGRYGGAELVVVTPRGVEIPIGRAADSWTIVEFTRLLAEIQLLPETPDRDGWSRKL